jgi:signal transduction histidine kinase
MVGLNEALSDLCSELSKFIRQPITYQGTAVPLLPDSVATAFYRFVQEALNNAVKHADAGHIRVMLKYQENCLSVTVEDDGVGFDRAGFDAPAGVSAYESRGVGLMSMHERLEMVGGVMEVDSAPGRGTRLIASYYVNQI